MHLDRQNVTENRKYRLQHSIILMVLREVKQKTTKEIMGVKENKVIITNTY